jgi:hypothetical protein
MENTVLRNDSHSSGVSWGAVIAGSFVAATLSLALLALGTGIGLSAASPWASAGAAASKIRWTAQGPLATEMTSKRFTNGYQTSSLS